MHLNSMKIALAFSGCFLGAGFVSGQELWQFFLSFGIRGIAGYFLSVALLFIFGVLLMKLASHSKISECDKLIIRADNKFLRAFISVAEVFFLAGIFVIMTAGVGELFHQTLSLKKHIVSALFVVLIFVLCLGGHRRMVAVFSLTVPLLVVFTLAVCVLSIQKLGFPDFTSVQAAAQPGTNPLLSSWWVSAITFVCYNLFSSVQILAPVGALIDSNRKIYKGIFFGTVILALIGLSIFISMSLCIVSYQAPLPMLYAASQLSPILGAIYSFLLFCGMLGTALSSAVAVVHFTIEKSAKPKIKIPCAAIVCIAAYFGSLVGFGELIGTIYPICGYLGVLALTALCEHYIYLKNKNRRVKNEQEK